MGLCAMALVSFEQVDTVHHFLQGIRTLVFASEYVPCYMLLINKINLFRTDEKKGTSAIKTHTMQCNTRVMLKQQREREAKAK